MKRDEVLKILADQRDTLKAFSVKSLSLFGSVARDEATEASDVDLLVEFYRPVGLFHLGVTGRPLSRNVLFQNGLWNPTAVCVTGDENTCFRSEFCVFLRENAWSDWSKHERKHQAYRLVNNVCHNEPQLGRP